MKEFQPGGLLFDRNARSFPRARSASDAADPRWEEAPRPRSGALVRRLSVVESWEIGEAGNRAPRAGTTDRRTGSIGSTPRMEAGREPARGSAQRGSVWPNERLARDPA